MNVCRWHGDFLPAVGGVQAHRPAPELSTTARRCDRRSSARARNLPAGLAACASRRPTKLGPVPVTAAASACWAWPSACRYWDGSLTHARTRDGQFELSLTLPVAASWCACTVVIADDQELMRSGPEMARRAVAVSAGLGALCGEPSPHPAHTICTGAPQGRSVLWEHRAATLRNTEAAQAGSRRCARAR